MKLYWNCNMGAAGDMLAASLLELCPNRAAALAELNALGIPGVEYQAEASKKCGIRGTHLRVLVHGQEEGAESALSHPGENTAVPTHSHPHTHAHHSMAEIAAVIGALHAPEAVRQNVLAIYQEIAQAESRVHGMPVAEVHLHEVGAMDAIADVSAVCLLLHRLAPESITASPIEVGGGTVRCAHGILPVPAPATAELLAGLPICGGAAECELCTPTGAALLRHFVQRYAAGLPAMALKATGHGCGQKNLPTANCVTAYWYEAADGTADTLPAEAAGPMDEITELRCNLDDMTPEAIGYAQEVLWAAGARDVFTTPIGMKKGRPGVLLTCLCAPAEATRFARLLLANTTTLGVRETVCRRYILHRESYTAQTALGPVRFKTAEGWGIRREKPEYDDLAALAQKNGLTLPEVRARLEDARK
ncbi:MAG: nickel pincer cofactor biosynthesis protein LarC [Faecalibacterium sp.]|jgi:uncharacterized protein (TIGR00299 family) protein|nr:nickel pincer cofactor biosynthesis protein LarC [Faecalibacterium sp.]